MRAEQIYDFAMPEPNSGCLLWIGPLNDGYARTWVDGKKVYVHRYLYEKIHGPVPTGLELDHKCRVRCCINDRHLEPVNHATNIIRSIEMDGKATHCKRGHPYSDKNTYRLNGKRWCRTCARLRESFRG